MKRSCPFALTDSVTEEETVKPISSEEILTIYERYDSMFGSFENKVADQNKPSIHILDDDCMRIIFSYLDFDSEELLRNVMFVCKRWFVMCGDMMFCVKSTALLKGFVVWNEPCRIIPSRIVLSLYFSKEYIEQLDISDSLHILGSDVIDNRNCIFQAIKQLCPNLSKLGIYTKGYSVISFGNVNSMAFPTKLCKLTLSTLSLGNDDLREIFKTTESLEILHLCLNFAPTVSIPPNVRELILDVYGYETGFSHDTFGDIELSSMLSTAKNLEILDMSQQSYGGTMMATMNELKNNRMRNIKFPLYGFDISSSLLQFMFNTYHETLEELNLPSCVSKIFDHFEFHGSPMKNLKHFSARDASNLSNLLKLMPVLEVLRITKGQEFGATENTSCPDYIDQIAELLPNVKILTLCRLPKNPYSLGGLKQIKTLEIESAVIDNVLTILEGLQRCTTLENVCLSNVQLSSYMVFIDVLQTLIKITTLKTLYMHRLGFGIMYRFIDLTEILRNRSEALLIIFEYSSVTKDFVLGNIPSHISLEFIRCRMPSGFDEHRKAYEQSRHQGSSQGV